MTTQPATTYLLGETPETAKGLKVFVYFNLHKKVFSVKALEGQNKGRVIAHAPVVNLKDCTFKVSEAGRQRVLRERKKNVHAGVVGYLQTDSENTSQDVESLKNDGFKTAYYNPYKTACFLDGDQPLINADSVALVNKAIYFKTK